MGEKAAMKAFQRTAILTLVVFVVFFLAGALIGWAIPDENAWAAWRLGLIVGAAGGALAFVIGLISSLLYISDNHLW